MIQIKSQHGFTSFLVLILFITLIGVFLSVQLIRQKQDIRKHAQDTSTSILLGTNYYNWAYPNCTWDNTGIIATYHQPNVRKNVQSQLAAMHNNDINSIRIIAAHMTDITDHVWGVIPSTEGTLAEPYRTNLTEFLSDIKTAGFRRVTFSFAPVGTNDPTAPNYDPSKFDENWQFISDVRPLIKQYGPAETHIDLLNEGAPPGSSVQNQTADYIRRVYQKYNTSFGKTDVTISAVMPIDAGGDKRFQRLIDVFNTSGFGQPAWYEIHLYGSGSQQDVLGTFAYIQDVLRTNHLTQPIVIGETWYNNAEIAKGIAVYVAQNPGSVNEVIQFFAPITEHWTEEKKCAPNPPFSMDEYVRVLNPFMTQAEGTIACAPSTLILAKGEQGTTTVTASWKNLVRGIINDATAQVCANFAGQSPTVFSEYGPDTHSLTQKASWIPAPATVFFTLYDKLGGKAPNCQGTILAQCRVETQEQTLSRIPTPPLTSISTPKSLPTLSVWKPVYLSDLPLQTLTNGWGPIEKDTSNGERQAGDGHTIRLDGQSYKKGLGVHGLSDVRYALAGKCSTFTVTIGIDDEVGNQGSVVFQVFADAEKLYDSSIVTGNTLAKHINIAVAGKKELQLVVTNGNDNPHYDHANWADAILMCAL